MTSKTKYGFSVLAVFIIAATYWILVGGRSGSDTKTDSQAEMVESPASSEPEVQANGEGTHVSERRSDHSDEVIDSATPDADKLHLVTKPVTPFPSGPLKQKLAEYEELANSGDFEIAMALSRALSLCAAAPRTADEFQQRKLNLETTQTDADGMLERDMDRSMSALMGSYEYCENLTDAEVERSGYWLWIAAMNGSLEAKTFFTSIYIPNLESESNKRYWGDAEAHSALGSQLLKEAADEGSANAIMLWGIHSMNGSLIEKNDIEAAAYLVAASRIFAESDGDDHRRRDLAEEALNQLSLRDLDTANDLAAEIVYSELCCTIFENN